MTCRAYNLGRRCTYPASPGASYCSAHTAIEAAARAAIRPDPYAFTPVNPSDFDGSTRLEDGSIRVDHEETKNSIGHCQSLNTHGEPCGFRPRKGHEYCINHDPSASDERAENARKGVEVRLRRLRERPSDTLLEIVTGFENRTAIQGVLDMTARLFVTGRITEKKAAVLGRLCAIASRNFDVPRRTMTGILPATHDWEAYEARLHALLQTIDPALEEALRTEAQLESGTAGDGSWRPGADEPAPGTGYQGPGTASGLGPRASELTVPGAIPLPFPEPPDFSAHFRKSGGLVDRHKFVRAVLAALDEGLMDPEPTVRWMAQCVDFDKKAGAETRGDLEEAINLAVAGGMLTHRRPWMSEGIWKVAENAWEPWVLWEQGLRSGKLLPPPHPAPPHL